jgi:RNA polymerase sigma factor (sigma-70 family)
LRLIENSRRPETPSTSERDELAIEHLEWARAIARHVASHLPTWFTADDLIGAAEIALLKLAAAYDPARGIPFRAFAQRRIYGACIDSVRRREYRERSHQTTDRLQSLCLKPSPEDQAAAGQNCRVWSVVQRLPQRHKLVILSVYGGGNTLVELSKKVGVGPARLSQIHREALGMMREELGRAA